MKRNIFALFALLCIISSCTNQQEELGSGGEKRLLVLHATNAGTTKMDITDPNNGRLSVSWSENDRIKVMNFTTSSDPAIFTATEADGHSATFEGYLGVSHSNTVYAFYPESLEVNDYVVSLNLSSQEGTLEYVSKNNVAAAKTVFYGSYPLDMTFKNKLAVLRIPISKFTSTPATLTISGADDSNKLIVSATLKTSDLNTWNENSYGKIVVPLTGLGETPTLYVLMFPQSTTLEFTLTDADGEVIWSRQAGVNLSVGSFYTFSAVSNNISFADEKVKALCVANWDTDGDGELSYAEAAAVTDLGEVFKSNTDITSFDELRYFTGLETISENAFYGCRSLTSITIPGSVKEIGDKAFYYCISLQPVTIPDNVTKIGDRTFAFCSSLQSVTIPEGVTSIGNSAFGNCKSLKEITIPEGVTEIGGAAFNQCTSLQSVTIPESVTEISESLFYQCTSLKSVTISGSVTKIGKTAFYQCTSLQSITIPSSVKTIGNEAFMDCSSLKNLVICEGLKTIGDGAFRNCTSLGDVVIPEGVTSIGERAFNDSSITSISLPSTLTSLGDYALCGCAKLKSLEIPYGVTSLGEYAIGHCSSLTSITLPNHTLKSIGTYTFCMCTSLTKITLPRSLRSIAGNAFYKCTALSYIYCNGTTPPTLSSSSFSGCSAISRIYVLYSALNTYKSASGWSNYASIILSM